MIWRDDLVEVIVAALKNGRAGEIYNATDDEPVSMLTFYRWLAETLGKWMPPFAPEEEQADRKRGLTSKKVQNRKMKVELGVTLKYPTFRQGYTAEIRRLEETGELNIEPEPR
jgi:nucleoside-diphosphate-sugar epimerase